MINLNDVSLIAVATKEVEETVQAIQYSLKSVSFDRVMLFAHFNPKPMATDYEFIQIEPFSSESSIDDALNKIELLHKRAIEYTKSLLDRQVIERIYQLIKNAKYIEIYGTGINFSLAEIYSLNFEEEGVISKAYNSLNPMHLQYLRQRKPNDTVCIYLTHTGQNKEMLKIAKDIRKYHAKSIVICDHKKREICKYCDETIVIMTTQNTTELSNAVYIASLQYVFNIFTSLKLISNYSYLEETTKAVDKFKMGE